MPSCSSRAEYNYSIPGVFKNAIDWASRPYGGKGSRWRSWALELMRMAAPAPISSAPMLRFLKMHAVNRPEVMIANASEKFDGQSKLTDEKGHNLIRHLLEALVALANSRELTNFRRISAT